MSFPACNSLLCALVFIPQLRLHFSRQTAGGKNIIGIHGRFDPVHDLPFRPRCTEDIVAIPEIVRGFNKQSVTVTLVDQFAYARPVVVADLIQTSQKPSASKVQKSCR